MPPTSTAEPPKLLSFKSSAAVTGLSVSMLRKLAREQALATSKIGGRRMIQRASLDRLIEQGTRQ